MKDAYTTADVDYRWKGGDDQGIEIVSAEMAQFDLVGVNTRTKAQTNSKGMDKNITCVFISRMHCTDPLTNADGTVDSLFLASCLSGITIYVSERFVSALYRHYLNTN